MNRRRLRQQCPECGRAGGAHAVYCTRLDSAEPEKKPPPDPHAEARAYFAAMEAKSKGFK